MPSIEAPPASAPAAAAGNEGVNVSDLAKGSGAPKSTAMQKALSSLHSKSEDTPKGRHAPKPVDRPKEVKLGYDEGDAPAKEEPPVEEPTKTDAPAKEEPAKEDKPAPVKEPADKAADRKLQPVSKYIDSLKTTNKNLEAQLSSLQAKLTAMGDMDAVHRRMEAAEKRKSELEEEIRYVSYQKSQEFQEKYQKPYEEVWAKAIADLKEIPITTGEGTSRPATAQDMLKLVNLPLGEARKAANEVFGDFANDVMDYYKEIRRLADSQTKALEDAKKGASEREQQMSAAQKRVAEEVGHLWEQFNTEDAKKHDFLKPKEGDEEWNSKLASATRFVDDAWKSTAADPKLTPEQRAEVVRKHAAIRNRAVGFSMLRYENKRLADQLAAVQKELDAIKGSAPKNGNGRPSSAAPGTVTNPLDRARQSLRQLAK